MSKAPAFCRSLIILSENRYMKMLFHHDVFWMRTVLTVGHDALIVPPQSVV